MLLALSDPTRRAILKRLARGSARVTDLARPMTMSLTRCRSTSACSSGPSSFSAGVPDASTFSFTCSGSIAPRSGLPRNGLKWTARLEALDTLLQAQDRGQDVPKIPRRKAPAARASRWLASRSAGSAFANADNLRRNRRERLEGSGGGAGGREAGAGVGPREQGKRMTS